MWGGGGGVVANREPGAYIYNIPGPSKGWQMVVKGCQLDNPLGFNWHPLEGAGIYVYIYIYLYIYIL